MADLRLRDLERQAAQGDPNAQKQLLRQRIRTGVVTYDQLCLLRMVGYQAAVEMTAAWKPELTGEALKIDPIEWADENDASFSADHTKDQFLSSASLRLGEFEAKHRLKVRDIEWTTTRQIRNAIVGTLVDDLREQLFQASCLPLGDWARVVAKMEQEGMLRISRALAHFILCLWEQEQAQNLGLSLEASGPGEEAQQIPVDGDHLNAVGMKKLGIPILPRSALVTFDSWLDYKNRPIQEAILEGLRSSLASLAGLHGSAGPRALLDLIASLKNPEESRLPDLMASAVHVAETWGDVDPDGVEDLLKNQVLQPAVLNWLDCGM